GAAGQSAGTRGRQPAALAAGTAAADDRRDRARLRGAVLGRRGCTGKDIAGRRAEDRRPVRRGDAPTGSRHSARRARRHRHAQGAGGVQAFPDRRPGEMAAAFRSGQPAGKVRISMSDAKTNLRDRRERGLAVYKEMGWGENEVVKELDPDLWAFTTDVLFGE